MRLKTTVLSAAALFGMLATQPATLLYAQEASTDAATATAPTTTTITNAIGTITSVNYNTDGTIEGFLVGSNVLLTFQGNVTGGIATLGAAGNSVTYSGTEVTDTTTGFSTVRVTSLTNNTTKATYTAPTPGTPTTPTSTAYTATGTIKQLNYDSNGLINGFVFTGSGSTTSVLVVIGATNNTTLQSLLKVGMTASVTGTERTASTTTGSLATVNASSLTIGGTTVIISGGGFGGGFGGPGRGPGGR